MCLLVGVVVTVVAGLIPAVRATRVPPVAVLREGATLPKSRRVARDAVHRDRAGPRRLRRCSCSGCSATAAARSSTCSARRPEHSRCSSASRCSRRVSSARSRGRSAHPAARFAGAPGRLARENATRNPGRTAVTASALMIGLALVTFVTVLAQGIRSSWGSTVRKQVSADYILTTSSGWDSFSPAAAAAIAREPGRRERLERPQRGGQGRQLEDDSSPASTPRTSAGSSTSRGSTARTRRSRRWEATARSCSSSFAEGSPPARRRRFRVRSPDGKRASLVVRGIHKPAGLDSLLGSVAVSNKRLRHAVLAPEEHDGVRRDEGQRVAGGARVGAEPLPDVTLNTESEFVKNQNAWIDNMLKLLYVLLGLSVLVSFFGIVNTLVLSIVERTRELGALRAVGMTTAPDAADDPAREHDHGADRRDDGASCSGSASAALVTRRLSDYSISTGGDGMHLAMPVDVADRLRARRGRGGRARGRPARAPRRAARTCWRRCSTNRPSVPRGGSPTLGRPSVFAREGYDPCSDRADLGPSVDELIQKQGRGDRASGDARRSRWSAIRHAGPGRGAARGARARPVTLAADAYALWRVDSGDGTLDGPGERRPVGRLRRARRRQAIDGEHGEAGARRPLVVDRRRLGRRG